MSGGGGIDPERLRAAVSSAREAIDATAVAVGRPAGEVELLVAGKYIRAQDAPILAAAGVRLVGENRLQDLAAKRATGEHGLVFDFIGHLQRRKVRDVVPAVRLIHSVDSVALAREISSRAEGTCRVLVEVNVASEPNKHGIAPSALDTFLDEVGQLPHLVVGGLMAMPPATVHPDGSRRHFAELRELRDRLQPGWCGRHDLRELSMGTSQDYLVAVQEGATIVRLGRGLLDSATVG